MEKRKVKKFKNGQKRLAKQIALLHGITNFTVDYEQQVPSACYNENTGKWTVKQGSQILFPAKVIHKGRTRTIVVMTFYGGKFKAQTVNRILQRPFSVKKIKNGFEIRQSFQPRTVANF